MKNTEWDNECRRLYNVALEKVRDGADGWEEIFEEADLAVLEANGISPVQFYDFADDFHRHGEPPYEIAHTLLTTRREYFLNTQKGVGSSTSIQPSDLPAKTDEIDGIPWLPRITRKAHHFLRGELNSDIMYGCGGDRKFFKEHAIHPLDFLRLVEAENADPARIASALQANA